jgi:hydroxyacylglutathione hydrolase
MTPAEVRDKLELAAFADELFAENCYVIRRRDTNRVLLVDPGLQASRVLEHLAREQLTVEKILVSHGHIDHVAGVPAIRRETGAPIAMHPDDLAILDWAHFAEMPFVPAGFEPFAIDEPLAHDHTICFEDITLRVLYTPGHTQGSVCFLFGPDCFSGDTLFARGIGRTDLPGGDTARIVVSIRTVLYRLPPKTVVYPGHGPSTTIEQEKLLNPFVPAVD